jgi:hypothetical protein
MISIRRSLERLQGPLRRVTRRWQPVLLSLGLLLLFSFESPPPASMEARINYELAGKRFDFAGWELRAIWRKITFDLVAPQRYMDSEHRRDFVLRFLALVEEVQRIDGEINRTYADPEVADPFTATIDLRNQRQELRTELRERQPLAEAILQEQVASVLEDEGFGALGQERPPVEIHFTPLPQLLILSPRDRIERIYQLSLAHGLGTTQREEIEADIDVTYDVSSLVTGIGGLSAYPSMLLESSSINWVTEVTAHEWTHHYLTPRPLGRNYLASAEARTINETVASLVGKSVGRTVVARYYPELLPPDAEPSTESSEEPEERGFDFRMEMRETRIRVDELLASGEIEEAEAYMERRREVFLGNGYAIRKLNQAYFAFHGAYADEPGAAGEDPIGPAVRKLFARSPNLRTFVNHVAGVTTLDELETLLNEA